MTPVTRSPLPADSAAGLLRERVARALVARLDTQPVPAPVEARLRAAREQSVARARARRAETRSGLALTASGAATMTIGAGRPSDEAGGWWQRPWGRWISAAVPLLALVIGLSAIQASTERARIRAAAAVDAALLADDLPPGAYSDPAFVEFLNNGRRP